MSRSASCILASSSVWIGSDGVALSRQSGQANSEQNWRSLIIIGLRRRSIASRSAKLQQDS